MHSSISLFQSYASFEWYFLQTTKCKYFSRNFSKRFETDFKKTEVYFLGNFYNKELCQTFSLKEIIQEPTGIASTTSSFLDHILTNAGCKISLKGVIDVGVLDHQLIYCTQKSFKGQGKYA